MARLFLKTIIHAPVDRCFDLSRSIDLHQISTADSGEKAVAGRTTGLIELGEFVTWRAKHFGVWQNLTTKIVALEPGVAFTDNMQAGAFKSFTHHHRFVFEDGKTIMEDEFIFESPFGILGKLVNLIVLNRYLANLLKSRNQVIKEYAETGQWKKVIVQENETNL